MSKEESSSGRGLLSKMVRFVRNPTVNWSELDSIDADRESQYSKQMLKEMIERKRRNDFVRRREFDQLRKLRQREALQGQRVEDPTARTSFFQTSMTSPDDRAETLKKIDEIEAQMSQQWWKSKPASGMPSQPAPPVPPAGRPLPATGVDATQPAPASAAIAAALAAAQAGPHGNAFAPTAPLSMPMPLDRAAPVEPLFADDALGSGFGTVEPPAVAASNPPAAPVAEPEKFVHEPDLEEAAIRFANGDYAGAETGLTEVLAQHQQDAPPQQHDLWMTLFDLYRATGQQDRFDTLAIDYAARFGRSAPLWFSLPEQLGLQGVAVAEPAQPAPAQRELSWSAQPMLAQQSVAALQASLARAAPPWTLNWARLTGMDLPAVSALADLFERWADQDVELRFLGMQALQSVLQAHTQSGDRGSDPQWWRLRMAALRLMGQPDEFELVALDYCVTYEVSPPSWAAPRCSFSGDDGMQAAPQAEAKDSDLFMSGFQLSQPAGMDDAAPAAALSGHIEGDAAPLLDPLEALVPPGQPLTVACDRLIRIDFAAIGSVLNWAAAQQAQGRVVQFTNLHRLAAVFFNVIGVNEHAWVIPRKN